MKKYLFAAACCLALVGMAQGCNESKDFDTSSFTKLCKYTNGVMKDGDETHCYCDNTKCEENVVCGNDGKCLAGSTPEPVPVTPVSPECNAENNGKTFCIVNGSSAGMATCNGVAFVMSANAACESNKCNANFTACEPVQQQPQNDPGCDAEHVGTTCTQNGNEVELKICAQATDGSYKFSSTVPNCNAVCDSNEDAGYKCVTPVEDPVCDADHVNAKFCKEGENNTVTLTTCEQDGEGNFEMSEAFGPDCHAVCDENEAAGYRCIDDEPELVCDADHIGDIKCVEDSDSQTVTISTCAQTEEGDFAFSAELTPECHATCDDSESEGYRCITPDVPPVPEPVCDADHADDEICVVDDGEAFIQICVLGRDGEYKFISKANGDCPLGCSDDGKSCKQDDTPVEGFVCDADHVNTKDCVDLDGVATARYCTQKANPEDPETMMYEIVKVACDSEACDANGEDCVELPPSD